MVTQPRRIAAISVAERVAAERGEPPPGTRDNANSGDHHHNSKNENDINNCGGGGGGGGARESGPAGPSTVGYHVRLDAAVTRSTRLTFCTTGGST